MDCFLVGWLVVCVWLAGLTLDYFELFNFLPFLFSINF